MWGPTPRLLAGCLVLMAVLAVFSERARADEPAPMDLGPPREAKTWTWIMYLGGDCDLEDSIVNELEIAERMLREPVIEDALRVVVLLDRAKGYTDRDGDWTGARILEAVPGRDKKTIESKELLDLGEVNLGDPRVLRAFVAGALKAFPSERVMMTISGHGSGWWLCVPDEDAPGANDGEDHLTTRELQWGLRTGLDAAGRKRFDVLTFEACLMGQLDVAYALRDLTDTILFSEGIAYGAVLASTYFLQLAWMEGSSRAAAETTLSGAPERYAEGTRARDGLSLTALDTSKIEDLKTALDALLLKLEATMDRDGPLYARALFHGENYIGTEDLERGTHSTASYDLLDVLDRMRLNHPDFPAKAEAAAVERAVHAATLASHMGYQRRRSRGIAIYAPFRPGNLNAAYRETPFARESKWGAFLSRLHGLQAANAPRPKISSHQIVDAQRRPTKTVRPLAGHRCEFVVDAPDLLVLEFGIGTLYKDVGHVIQFTTRHQVPVPDERRQGLSLARQEMLFTPYASGRNVAAQELGGVYLRLASGTEMAYATVSTDDHLVSVRGTLSDTDIGEDQDTTLSFAPETWELVSAIVHRKNKRGHPIGDVHVAPSPEAVFKPTLDLVTLQGKLHRVTHGELVWKEGPRLVLDVVEPGEQALFLKAIAVAGTQTVERVPYSVEANPLLEAARTGAAPSLSDLVGNWRIHRASGELEGTNGEFTTAGGHLAIEPDAQGRRGRFTWRMWGEGALSGGEGQYEATGLPTLSLHMDNAWGQPLRRFFYAVVPEAGGTFRLRDLSAPAWARLVPEKRTTSSTGTAHALIGTWRSSDGLVLTMTRDAYRLEQEGELIDRGTWSADESRIRVTNEEGEMETVAFTLRRGVLRITDEDGAIFVLKRDASGGQD